MNYRPQSPSADPVARRRLTALLFYVVGFSILLYVVTRLPFADVTEALRIVGPEDAWLIFVPVAWVVPYALTLCVLLDHRVTFRDALYTQISGDAFNSLTPLLGFGGEPYKAAHLANFVPLDDASHAIIQSRVIHALSGVMFTAAVVVAAIFLVDLSAVPGFAAALWLVATSMVAVSILLLWLARSRAPSRLAALILSKLKLVEEFRHDRLSWSRLIAATTYKLIGRAGKFLELYLIFLVLDITPEFADVVLVEAMIMASVSIFFLVPQGLGVNEAGILAAFSIAGYAAATGVAYGLLRRARMIVYALFGLLIYLLGKLTGFGKSRYRSGAVTA